MFSHLFQPPNCWPVTTIDCFACTATFSSTTKRTSTYLLLTCYYYTSCLVIIVILQVRTESIEGMSLLLNSILQFFLLPFLLGIKDNQRLCM